MKRFLHILFLALPVGSSPLPAWAAGQPDNTSLTAWYALNASHYSHNAAIKQSHIQKRTASSLLLSLGFLASEMKILDSAKYQTSVM